jgi:hypothetical protein
MNTKLTAKETALMTAIAERHFSFFDQGIVAGSGIWTEDMTAELMGSKYEVSKTQRGAASVINSLARKGLLITVPAQDEDEAWTELTEAGQAWCEENFPAEEETVEEAPVAEEAPAEVALETETFKIVEFKDEDAEWIETTFADGSKTLRRRRQVSGAWRTDFWGITAEGKRVATSSKAAKEAREAGTFTI